MKKKIMLTGPVTDVAYSPDGKYLVASDGNRKGKYSLKILQNESENYEALTKVNDFNYFLC